MITPIASANISNFLYSFESIALAPIFAPDRSKLHNYGQAWYSVLLIRSNRQIYLKLARLY